jgi:hypothetical protein
MVDFTNPTPAPSWLHEGAEVFVYDPRWKEHWRFAGDSVGLVRRFRVRKVTTLFAYLDPGGDTPYDLATLKNGFREIRPITDLQCLAIDKRQQAWSLIDRLAPRLVYRKGETDEERLNRVKAVQSELAEPIVLLEEAQRLEEEREQQ